MRYDYLLVVGPGRSGSDFLYRRLSDHPDLARPEIKEGYCYRNPAGRRRAQRQMRRHPGQILPDLANLAYKDPALLPGLARMQADGGRILLVVLLRDHHDRAVSMLRFRKSRGEFAALRGRRRLEKSVVQDRLTPDRLQAIYDAGADVLTIGFPALTACTEATLDALASVCGIARFPAGAAQSYPFNESTAARSLWLSALGKLTAVLLRRLGCRRTLQTLKDSPRIRRLFLTPLRPDAASSPDARPQLEPAAVRLLTQDYAACRALAKSGSQRLADGVYFRPANAPPTD